MHWASSCLCFKVHDFIVHFCLCGVLRPNFHSYRDVTITIEGPQNFTYSRHSLTLSSDTPTVHRIWSSQWTRDTHTYCRAFGSAAVTTYILRLKPLKHACEANALPTVSPQRCCSTVIEKILIRN